MVTSYVLVIIVKQIFDILCSVCAVVSVVVSRHHQNGVYVAVGISCSMLETIIKIVYFRI